MLVKPPLGVQLIPGHPMNKNLVGWWLMNEGAGGQVYDLSGNGNRGTLVDNAHWVSDQYGPCLSFDGDGDYVEIPNIGSPSYLTISAWVYPNSWSNNFPRIVDRVYNGQFAFYFTATGLLSWALCTAQGDVDYGTRSNVSMSTGVWSHVVLTYDGTSARTYVNGVLRETYSTNLGGVLDTSSSAIRLAQRVDAGDSRAFDGKIDDVMIYDRALSAEEIKALYADPFQGLRQTPVDLWTAATSIGAPPPPAAGYMTLNTGYWG